MNIDEIKEKLVSSKSKDRQRAAKAIGVEKHQVLGDELYSAYMKERSDKRTWQTQFEMIRSLGLIDYKPALEMISHIVEANDPLDMITSAAAESHVRLARKSTNDAKSIVELLSFGSLSVIDGVLLVLAEDQMIPSNEQIEEIIKISWDINKHKDRIGQEYGIMDSRIYLALACHNWDIDLTDQFLNHCIETAYNINSFGKPVENRNLIDVCNNSLKGKQSKGYL